uniref:Uncharacterized protein n=1 Tax=Pipistrellus kuhlii TaxID=59472 RepID=A0A7J7V0T9_PIPKU|nr:hypothetical protein mPipKuh1_008664 [Pipistrellus kuhlii]
MGPADASGPVQQPAHRLEGSESPESPGRVCGTWRAGHRPQTWQGESRWAPGPATPSPSRPRPSPRTAGFPSGATEASAHSGVRSPAPANGRDRDNSHPLWTAGSSQAVWPPETPRAAGSEQGPGVLLCTV